MALKVLRQQLSSGGRRAGIPTCSFPVEPRALPGMTSAENDLWGWSSFPYRIRSQTKLLFVGLLRLTMRTGCMGEISHRFGLTFVRLLAVISLLCFSGIEPLAVAAPREPVARTASRRWRKSQQRRAADDLALPKTATPPPQAGELEALARQMRDPDEQVAAHAFLRLA